MKMIKVGNYEFKLAVNIGSAKRVKALTDYDILDLSDEEENIIGLIKTNPVVLADIVTAIIQPQLDKIKLSAEDFQDLLVGDVLLELADSLLEEIANFFPTRQKSLLLRELAKIKEAEAKIYEEMADGSGEKSTESQE